VRYWAKSGSSPDISPNAKKRRNWYLYRGLGYCVLSFFEKKKKEQSQEEGGVCINLKSGELVLIGGSLIRKDLAEGCHVIMEGCLYHRFLRPSLFLWLGVRDNNLPVSCERDR